MKSMVFIDYQNFNISKNKYLLSNNENWFNINFSKLAKEINNLTTLNTTMVKTYLFAYKPCETLLKIQNYKDYYSWLNGLKNKPFFEVIEGTQEIRQTSQNIKIDLDDPKTYTTQEKGTDINLAVNMLSKGYQNAYDVAILVSGDSDYIPVIRELHHIGKIVILATLPNQNINKFNAYKDFHIKIDLPLLKRCTNNTNI